MPAGSSDNANEKLRTVAADARAVCPRCGYDLRGMVVTWEDSCPLAGRCAECGLDLNWAEILRPEKFEPRWCIEFVDLRRCLPRACFGTVFRTLAPWRFWSRMKMSFDIRPRRLAIYAIFLIVPLFVMYAAVQGSVAIYVRFQVQASIDRQQGSLPMAINSVQRSLQALKPGTGSDLSPQETQRQIQNLERWLDRYQARIVTPPVIDHSYFEAVVEAVILPFKRESWGRIIYPLEAPHPYVAPADLHNHAFGSDRYWWATRANLPEILRQYLYQSLWPALSFAGAGTAGMVVLPLTFIVLPISRRRARVRWPHVWRIFVYGLFIPSAIAIACGGLFAIGFFLDDWSVFSRTWVIRVAGYGPWILLFLWWWVAIRNYLKVPHAFAVAFLLAAMSALIIAATLFVVFEYILGGIDWNSLTW